MTRYISPTINNRENLIMINVTDLATFKATKKEFYADIDAVFAKYGMTPAGGNASFGSLDATFKFKVKLGTGDPEARADKEKANYDNYARLYGLQDVPFGAKFSWFGGKQKFEVIGLKTSRRSDKVVVLKEINTGKTGYLVTAEQVKTMYASHRIAS
jgi:hypothetical protein